MTLRPLVVVSLTVAALLLLIQVLQVFLTYGATILAIDPKIFEFIGYRIMLIPVVVVGICAMVIWKRHVIAGRIVGPVDEEREYVSRQMCLSSAFGVLGFVLVLIAALPLSGLLLFVDSKIVLALAEAGGVVGPSLQMAVGAILIFFHPVLAATLAPEDPERE